MTNDYFVTMIELISTRNGGMRLWSMKVADGRRVGLVRDQ